MVRTRRRTGRSITRGLRPGGRSARVVESVFAATRKELARVGYSRLSMEVVARKAGVNKTTVYRRWPTKASLVAAAIEEQLVFAPAPPQASLRDDLLTLTHRLDRWMGTPEGKVVTRGLAAELHRPEVLALTRTAKLKVKEEWAAAVDRAIARGELPPGSDIDLIYELITGTMVDAFVRVTHVVDDRFIEGIVNLVATGATHGGAVERRAARRPRR